MTSRSRALVAPPSWGSAPRALRGDAHPLPPPRAAVRWGIAGRAGLDVAAGAALLAATAGLWAAFLAAAW